ncbi:hypothetical protein QJ48_00930 [Paenibacillus sp. A3]|uniref:hypothetical protein n=1 Tax=Paenibacillus sp. A3 TaxID=1337054 RepID=UPI0006D57D39|nr:hypothetical protein [Paenibacillus sp. A3]KPV61252.1 hypothetical protein QJ48_00930 [Paenibacillus sp. A3]
MQDVQFIENQVHFQNYPFQASSIYPHGSVASEDISEILIARCPPEVRLKSDEVLFVSAVHKESLKLFAKSNNIPIVSRVDTWSFICEEFLDTEFSDEDKEKVYRLLENEGLDRNFVKEMRQFLYNPMMAYNSIMWDWAHLGLYDVLLAVSGQFPYGEKVKFTEEAFRDFYSNAMKLAMSERNR